MFRKMSSCYRSGTVGTNRRPNNTCMLAPDSALLDAAPGEVALVVEPLPLRGVGGVGIGPRQAVGGGAVLVKE